MSWLSVLLFAAPAAAAVWGWLRSVQQERRFNEERLKRIEAEAAARTAREQAETYRRGRDVADERRKRTEEVIGVYRAEAEKWRRTTLERIESDGRAALGAAEAGDPVPAGRVLADVLRADADDHGAHSGGGAAADGRGAPAGRVPGFPGAGRPGS